MLCGDYCGLDSTALFISKMSIWDYMRNCNQLDLIALIISICKEISIKIEEKWIKENAVNVFWFIKSNE